MLHDDDLANHLHLIPGRRARDYVLKKAERLRVEHERLTRPVLDADGVVAIVVHRAKAVGAEHVVVHVNSGERRVDETVAGTPVNPSVVHRALRQVSSRRTAVLQVTISPRVYRSSTKHTQDRITAMIVARAADATLVAHFALRLVVLRFTFASRGYETMAETVQHTHVLRHGDKERTRTEFRGNDQ